MKKFLAVLCCLAVVLSSFGFVGCGSEADLRVYNCYDYIDETLIEGFENYYQEKTGKKIKVEYSCFDTPEDAYNTLKIDGSRYDLVCPSDYMIQKMAVEGMLEEIELNKDGNYNKYVSPFIKEKFESVTWKDGDKTKNLSSYAAGYMWGTLGMVYNPDKVTADDMTTWDTLWTNNAYNKKFSIKDSVRDTYFIGLAKYHRDELLKANGDTEKIYDLFNDTSVETVNAVKDLLFTLKDNSKNMEIDEGKEDIIKGDIDIYFAWSGDAVYAMDEAEDSDNPVYLEYSVPEEGSNVWFDGWCVPKGAKNKDLALEFIDYLSAPENVIKNMEYIGYVSCIGGDDVFDWVVENYGDDEGEFSTDLKYFFGGEDRIVKFSEQNRQFTAQYPSEEVISRCALMSYFPADVNDRITNMWVEVKNH